MLKLAVEGNPNFEISDIEIERGGISYTIDTIRDIKNELNFKDDKLFYLIGSDCLLDFHNWKDSESILGYYTEFNLPIFHGLRFLLQI